MAISKKTLKGEELCIKGVKIISAGNGLNNHLIENHRIIKFSSMRGMGDNIFQRPFVHTLCGIYNAVFLDTPWPHLYWDMPSNLKFVRPRTNLRTQKKNIEYFEEEEDYRTRQGFSFLPSFPSTVSRLCRAGYSFRNKRTTVYKEFMKRGLPLKGFHFHMIPPDIWGDEIPLDVDEPFCLVRNTTMRYEWLNLSRNCKNKYLQIAAEKYKKSTGHTIIEIADIDGINEKLVGDPIQCADIRLVEGELKHPGLIWAFKHANAVISCTGFALPLAQMVKANALIIFGGYEIPRWFEHPKHECPRVQTITPNTLCGCCDRDHKCNLNISPRRLTKSIDSLIRNQTS